MLRASVALAVLVFGIGARSSWAQAPVAPNVGPPGPPPNGEQLYMENCAECHGPEGDAVPDVDLGHGRFRRATTDPELVGIVLRGIPNTAMPPSNFSEAQASAIVQYLRAKASRAAASAGNARERAGDLHGQGQLHELPSRQRQRLAPRARTSARSAGCGTRPTSSARLSIPTSLIVPSNRFVRLVTRDGATITGRLLNQDAFTVQLLDSKEQLRSLHARRPQGIHVHRQIADAVVSRKAEPRRR